MRTRTYNFTLLIYMSVPVINIREMGFYLFIYCRPMFSKQTELFVRGRVNQQCTAMFCYGDSPNLAPLFTGQARNRQKPVAEQSKHFTVQ